MIKWLFLFTLFIFIFRAEAIDLKKHPIYAQIIQNKPSIDKTYAMKLSNIIYKMHLKYHIPTRVFTAILMQESGYTLSAKGCHSGIIQKDSEICNSDKYVADPIMCSEPEVRVCTDFGISQIYYKTAKRFGFSLEKLTKDLEYSVESGAKVLTDFMKRYEAKDIDWWTRYNCGTKGSTKRDTCQIYKRLVKRYL